MRIGIDLGGTKIEGIVLDGGGCEHGRIRRPTPRDDYPATLDAIRAIVEELSAPDATVGIGIPGAISPETGLVRNANSTWLIGKPFDRDLADRLGRPVRVANDANCFAMSEATDGAAAGAETVFGVILGTGVGGGIVHQGRLWVGANAIGGEWGHNPLPWPSNDEHPGRACYCGKQGCLETWLSGPGLVGDHAQRTGRALASVEDLIDLSDGGDQAAAASLTRHSDRLARGLASVINVIDPDVIVLGGGLSNLDHLYLQTQERLSRYVFSDSVATRIVKNRHGDSSGVRGAAWLWPQAPSAT